MMRDISITPDMLKKYKDSKGYTCLNCGKGDYDNCCINSDGGELYVDDNDKVSAYNDVYCTECNAQWTDRLEYSHMVINHYTIGPDDMETVADSTVLEGESQGVCPYCGDCNKEGCECESYIEDDDGSVVRGMQCGSCKKNYQEVYTLSTVEGLKIKTTPSARFILDK